MTETNKFRIVFWNIQHGGGSRAGNIVEQILDWQADLVALAEFRATAPSRSIAKSLREAGLRHQLSAVDAENPTWNAVFLASRYPLSRIRVEGAPAPDLYWLLAGAKTKPSICIAAVHAPWSIYLGRLEYYEALLHVVRNWNCGPGAIIGDMNSGIDGRDNETENSVAYNETVMSPLQAEGWTDPFRRLHPDADAPTWFSPCGNGYRLDQAFVNSELQTCVTSCEYSWGPGEEQAGLSDHAAILLDLEIPA